MRRCCRVVKDFFGDGITAEEIRSKYGKPEQPAKQAKQEDAKPKAADSASAVVAAMKVPVSSSTAAK